MGTSRGIRRGRLSGLVVASLLGTVACLGALVPDGGALASDAPALDPDSGRTGSRSDRRAAGDPRGPNRPSEQRSWDPERRLASTIEAGGVPVASLVHAAQGGDRVAFDELCRRYFERIFIVAHACVRNRHDAEDVAQQVVVSL